LGAQRGVAEYHRFALLQREPLSPKKATPLGRVRVRENPRASLISELDANGWLSRARRAVREKTAPDSLGTLGSDLDKALFRLAGDGSTEAVQEALIAIGALMLEAKRRPKLRESLPPPPRLSAEWATAADDGSHEFALAEALASLDARAEKFRLPFRRHLVPIDWPKGRETWDDTTGSKALAVWTGRDLIRDMAAALERRLIEAHRHCFANQGTAELPLRGCRPAPLAAVAAFLAGRTDDHQIAAFAAGLAWTKARTGTSSGIEREDVLPFAYAALKPIFAFDGVGLKAGEKRLLDPLPLVRLIRASRVTDAIRKAQQMARGAGLPTPFAQLEPTSSPDPDRLAAALLFPIAPMAYDRLIARAYPDITKDKEEVHAA
jgi:CRISPR-associated protein Csx17